jgi:hypothetical protein
MSSFGLSKGGVDLREEKDITVRDEDALSLLTNIVAELRIANLHNTLKTDVIIKSTEVES